MKFRRTSASLEEPALAAAEPVASVATAESVIRTSVPRVRKGGILFPAIEPRKLLTARMLQLSPDSGFRAKLAGSVLIFTSFSFRSLCQT
jgi:hypothetical protein